MPLGFLVSRPPRHSYWYEEQKRLKGSGDVLLHAKWQTLRGIGKVGNQQAVVTGFSFIWDYLVVLSLWESGIALRIQTWIYLEITLKGKNNNTNYIQAYLRSKVTGSAAWSKCKFSCSGFPSILVPQLIAQNHSSIELDAASKGWIGWLFISIRPKSDHCLALVTPSCHWPMLLRLDWCDPVMCEIVRAAAVYFMERSSSLLMTE